MGKKEMVCEVMIKTLYCEIKESDRTQRKAMTTSKLPQRAKAVCGIDLLGPSFNTEGRP